jgi:5-methyltetrahydropteroyltriglutamate--homocysteine methyltransferase
VIDVGTDEVERPELVADRLRAALEVLPPTHLIAAPGCGCVARDRQATRAKLRAMVLGAQAVRLELAMRG